MFQHRSPSILLALAPPSPSLPPPPMPADDVNTTTAAMILSGVCRAWMVSCGMSIDALPTCFENTRKHIHTHESPIWICTRAYCAGKSASWNIRNDLTTFLLASSNVVFSILIYIPSLRVHSTHQPAQSATRFQHNLWWNWNSYSHKFP